MSYKTRAVRNGNSNSYDVTLGFVAKIFLSAAGILLASSIVGLVMLYSNVQVVINQIENLKSRVIWHITDQEAHRESGEHKTERTKALILEQLNHHNRAMHNDNP